MPVGTKWETGSFGSTCSVGIALCGIDECPLSVLIERADQAVYRAKRENKGAASCGKAPLKGIWLSDWRFL